GQDWGVADRFGVAADRFGVAADRSGVAADRSGVAADRSVAVATGVGRFRSVSLGSAATHRLAEAQRVAVHLADRRRLCPVLPAPDAAERAAGTLDDAVEDRRLAARRRRDALPLPVARLGGARVRVAGAVAVPDALDAEARACVARRGSGRARRAGRAAARPGRRDAETADAVRACVAGLLVGAPRA